MNPRFLRFQPRHKRGAFLADALYDELEAKVIRVTMRRLRVKHVTLDVSDVEEAYNQAWNSIVHAIAQGQRVRNLTGLLVDISYKRSLNAYEQQRHEAIQMEVNLDVAVVEVDIAEQLDDEHKLKRLIGRLRERLTDNERKAISLCVLHGYSRAEAAAILGVEEPAFKKLMERATAKMDTVVAAIEARSCSDDEWSATLLSFAHGLIGENHPDFSRISKHIEDCASCRRYVNGLRGLSAALPPLGLRFRPVGAHHAAPIAHAGVAAVGTKVGIAVAGLAAAGTVVALQVTTPATPLQRPAAARARAASPTAHVSQGRRAPRGEVHSRKGTAALASGRRASEHRRRLPR